MTPSGTPTPITNRLRRAQGETGATLWLLHRAGAVELYRRQRRAGAVDYAAVRGTSTAHGPTPTDALGALRARQTARTRPLTWADGVAAGFSDTCLHGFCAANGLVPDDALTPAELQRVGARNLAANWPHYARGLRRLGIHLRPPGPA